MEDEEAEEEVFEEEIVWEVKIDEILEGHLLALIAMK